MKKLLLIPILSLLLVSCNDDDPQVFGPTQNIVGFDTEKTSRSFLTDQTSGTISIPVDLIAFPNDVLPDSDISMTYTIESTSTATAGVEYLTPANNQVSITAGNTVGYINLDVVPTTFDPFAPKTVVLKLSTVSSSNAIIGEQYKMIEVTLQGVCNSQLQGSYTNATFRFSNNTTYTWTDEVITKDEGTDATYTGNHVGQYYGASQVPATVTGTGAASAQLAPPVALFHFSDICDNIKVYQHNLADAYTNIVTQSDAQYALSTADDDTGVIVIEYSIWFTNNTIERKFRGTYTPNP